MTRDDWQPKSEIICESILSNPWPVVTAPLRRLRPEPAQVLSNVCGGLGPVTADTDPWLCGEVARNQHDVFRGLTEAGLSR